MKSEPPRLPIILGVIFYKFLYFLNFKVEPYLYLPDDLSVSVTEGYSVNISCYLLVGTENGQNINWTWKFNDLNLIQNDKYLIDASSNYNSTITIQNVELADRGNYYCQAVNTFNQTRQVIILRVRSNCII